MKGVPANESFADVVYTTDIRVRNLTRCANLIVKSRQHRPICGERFRQELQGNELSQLQVFRLVNLSHASLAEQADDSVAAGEQRSGNEAALVDRGCFQFVRVESHGERVVEG
jgi:hypothetical protein